MFNFSEVKTARVNPNLMGSYTKFFLKSSKNLLNIYDEYMEVFDITVKRCGLS